MSLDKTSNEILNASHQSIHKYLILKSQEGDHKAQRELYQLYAKAMFNICRRMMGNDEDAQDVLQDAFIDAFTRLHTLKNVNTFSAWLKRIVINRCINAIKKRRLVTVDVDEGYDFVQQEEEDNELMKYQANQIIDSMDELSDGCKMVMNLYLFEGYDHGEIANILSISESASKSQYCKAKIKLRKVLEEKKTQLYGR